MKLVFASNNANKFREIEGLIPKNIHLLSLQDIGFHEDIEETGQTLEENSKLKAQIIYDFCGIATIADDTGLEVQALNGNPGVYSARYAGEQKSSLDNMTKLLAELADKNDRSAQFRTVFTLITEQGCEQFEGVVKGQIATEQHGDAGFGYDPIFYPEGNILTFAQMPLAQKNTMSHRARALEKLIHFLTQNYAHVD